MKNKLFLLTIILSAIITALCVIEFLITDNRIWVYPALVGTIVLATLEIILELYRNNK